MHIPLDATSCEPTVIQLADIFSTKDDSPSGGGNLRQWSSIIGIVTAIVGNLLISFALNTQRYAHIRIDREHTQRRKSSPNRHPSIRQGGGYGTQEEIADDWSKRNLEISDQKTAVDEEAAGPIHQPNASLQPPAKDQDQDDDQETDSDDESGRTSYLRSPYWWLGLVLMIVGEAGNFLAYGFAPASIVSPLGVVALIANCLIAPLMLKERFRRRDFLGVLVAITGAVVVVLSASNTETKLGPGELWRTIKRWEFLLYVIITVVLIVGLLYLEPRYGRKTILVDIGLVALFGGYTALSTKGVSSLLSGSLYKAFTFPIFYFLVLILVGSALMQIRYLNRALQNYDSTQVIPTQFVLFTLSVIIGSAVLYRDFEHTSLDRAVKFVVGCVLTFFGVYLITSQRYDNEDAEEDEENGDETIRLIDEEVQDVDEQTPLTRNPAKVALAASQDHLVGQNREDELAVPRTPPQRPSAPSSIIPSISVTPAQSSEDIITTPWSSSTEEVNAVSQSRTPQIIRLQSEATPYFTPETSKPPYHERSSSSPADPETPTKPPRISSPHRLQIAPRDQRRKTKSLHLASFHDLPEVAYHVSFLFQVHSYLRFRTPSPHLWRTHYSGAKVLLAPCVPHFAGHRSTKTSLDDRRRTVALTEGVDDPLTALNAHWADRNADSAHSLSRSRTHEAVPYLMGSQRGGSSQQDAEVGRDMGKRKTRLRALSETLSGMMGRNPNKRNQNGKGRDDSDAQAAHVGGR